MILSIDPGREKFGWALVMNDRSLICSGITLIEDLDLFVKLLQTDPCRLDRWTLEGRAEDLLEPLQSICCGNGTGRKKYFPSLSRLGLPVDVVDEHNTTLDARQIYWNLHPRRGFSALLPQSLLVPPRCIDDLAAYCIAMRETHSKYRP